MKVQLCIIAVILALSAGATIKKPMLPLPRLIDPRIINGTAVDIASHPHQITLRVKHILYPENPFTHSCGGSIVANNLVVTAAHCIIGKVPSQFQVIAGTNDRRGTSGVIVPVKEIIMHENYNPETYDYDIAILVLGAPLPLNNYNIKAVQLTENDPRPGSLSSITGWGTTEKGYPPETLMEVHAPVISNEDCNIDYYDRVITPSMLCAGYRGIGGKDACQGDSGGPLVVDGKLAGIVSWGYGCAAPEFPGVYARVSYLYPWLMEKINKYA